MSRFNTGNKIDSDGLKDLSDNAKNADLFSNDVDNESYKDRFGRNRKTIHGMESEFDRDQEHRKEQYDSSYEQWENDFNSAQDERKDKFDAAQKDRDDRFKEFLISSGYHFTGDYAEGVELTDYNQIVRDADGEFWRASGKTDLPYTLTGEGVDEGGALVSLGDNVLRQQLQGQDGSSMIGHGEYTAHDYISGINNPADKSSYTELDGYNSIQNDKWNYNIGASDERYRVLNSGNPGGIKPIQPYVANAVISFADFRAFLAVRVPVQVVSGAALLPISDITASTFESPAIYCPFFHYNFYAQARNTFKYIGTTPLSVVMYGQVKMRIRVSNTNCEDVRASGVSELLAPTSTLSIRQVNAKGDPVEYKDYGLDIVYNRRDAEIYKIDPLENSNNKPDLDDKELFILMEKDPSGFDTIQFDSVAGYGIEPNSISEELVKYRDNDKTTDWIPTKGYTKFLIKRVKGSPWRLQYKDQYGRIYYDSAVSSVAKQDEEMVYNIPSKARYLRVFYSGHNDTSDMLSIHAMNEKYDMNFGSWCTVEFNVCTHQTFEPNGEYQFIVQNYDGPRNIAITPNGIQIDTAAIFFSFNYNDYLVDMGELKW